MSRCLPLGCCKALCSTPPDVYAGTRVLLLPYVYAGPRKQVQGMKTQMPTILMMFLAVTMAAAQAQSDRPATGPITGIDTAALAGSARASKVIGSKVYKGDAAVGQIEDVLIFLDHASVTGVVLSVGGFLGLRKTRCGTGQPDQSEQRGKIHDRADQGTACGCTRIRLWQT